MMNKVEEALEWYDAHKDREPSTVGGHHAFALAAEVRRLRLQVEDERARAFRDMAQKANFRVEHGGDLKGFEAYLGFKAARGKE